MRRGLLLMAGFLGSILAGMLLWQNTVPGGASELPFEVEQTGITVLELQSYDGPFLEDGSRRQVCGVAAVVLHNSTDSILEKGAVKLMQEDRLLVFSFTHLPPDGRVLVLESQGKHYSDASVDAVWGWSMKGGADFRIRVEESGRTALAVINVGDNTIEEAMVYYKDYDPGQRLLLGGITHSVAVRDLKPGHRAVIPVYGYISGSSIVIP